MPETPPFVNVDTIVDTETFVKIGPITVGSRTAEVARLVSRVRTRKDLSVEILDEQVELLWGQTVQGIQDALTAEKVRLAEETTKVDTKIADLEVIKVAEVGEVVSG